MLQAAQAGEAVATVTDNERDEILRLHERKAALKELFLSLNSPYLTEEEEMSLRGKLVIDLARTNALYEKWWREIQTKYSLKICGHGELLIDFESRQVFSGSRESMEEDGCSCGKTPMPA